MEEEALSLDHMPLEISFQVLEHLTVKQLLFLQLVSKGWQDMTNAFIYQRKELDLSSLSLHIDKVITHFLLPRFPPTLRRLSFKKCFKMFDKDFSPILQRFVSLQSLNLEGCTRLTERTLSLGMSTAPLVTTLQALNLTGTKVTASGISSLLEKMPKLEYLNLNGCENIDIIKPLAGRSYVAPLRHLSINKTKLSDTGMSVIAESFQGLEYLSCEESIGFTNTGIIALASKCHSLVSINLSWCNNVKDEAIIAIAQGCPNLLSLEVESLYELTDLAIAELAQKCPKLRNLQLEQCFKLAEGSTSAISANCAELKYLKIRGCQKMDAEQLRSSLPNCDVVNQKSQRVNVTIQYNDEGGPLFFQW